MFKDRLSTIRGCVKGSKVKYAKWSIYELKRLYVRHKIMADLNFNNLKSHFNYGIICSVSAPGASLPFLEHFASILRVSTCCLS